jgi:hypothetical protein
MYIHTRGAQDLPRIRIPENAGPVNRGENWCNSSTISRMERGAPIIEVAPVPYKSPTASWSGVNYDYQGRKLQRKM